MIRYAKHVRSLVLGASIVGAASCGPGDITGDDDDVELTGTIVVASTTTGPRSDPDGYLALLDEGLAQPIEASGSVTFADVRAGTHNVRLDDVEAPCVLTTPIPVYVLLMQDSTVNVQLDVSCS